MKSEKSGVRSKVVQTIDFIVWLVVLAPLFFLCGYKLTEYLKGANEANEG